MKRHPVAESLIDRYLREQDDMDDTPSDDTFSPDIDDLTPDEQDDDDMSYDDDDDDIAAMSSPPQESTRSRRSRRKRR